MANLYLSHWKSNEKVYVPQNICDQLKSYQTSIIRSLYGCYQKKFDGAVLNYDEGIDVQLAFVALWQALINANKVKLPFLIIVSEENVIKWHYYLSRLGNVSILNSENSKRILESTDFAIILVPVCNMKLLQAHQETGFSFVVIEDFDKIAAKRLFKHLDGHFNVALIRKNLMVNRDFKTIWHILNWTNPGKFGKLGDFEEYDRDHLDNLRNPYDDVWYTYNYNNVSEYNLGEDEQEKEEFEKILSDWASKHHLPPPPKSNPPKKTRGKRKTNSSKSRKSKKPKQTPSEEEKRYHEQETQIVGNVDEKSFDEVMQDVNKEKNLRDITDLNYTQIVNNEKTETSKNDKHQPSFNSSFLKKKNGKRKLFEFMEEKQKSINETSKQIEDTHNGLNSKKTKENPVFPSLEDILKFKKRPIHISPPRKPATNINGDVHSNNTYKQSKPQHLDDLSRVSLEEIFKCKRKLVNNPQNLAKTNTNKCASTNSPTKNGSSTLPETSTPVSKTKCITVNSNNSRTKTVKVCNRYKIVYKRSPETVPMTSKETQTSDSVVDGQRTKQRKDAGTETAETRINFSENVIDDSQKSVGRDLKEGNLKSENDKDIGVMEADKFTTDNSIKKAEIVQSPSSSSRGQPLQNLTNMDGDFEKDEEEGVLLSIIEGKFSSQSCTNLTHKPKLASTVDVNNFKRHNSQLLLGSLFGDEVICPENEINENNLEDSTDNILSKLNNLASKSVLQTHLKVKSIDQINQETSSPMTQSTCESLKVLFGSQDERSDLFSVNHKLDVHKYNEHNLISSLFG